MNNLKRIISVITVACILLSMPLTAFASDFYKQVQYLSDEEILNEMWENVMPSNGTEIAEQTGDTFFLSYNYQNLKDFIKSYQIPKGDFKVSDLRDVYYESYQDRTTAIVPYSEKVSKHLDSHPNETIDWSFDSSKKKYVCSADGQEIDSFITDTYVEYAKQNVSDKTFWSYDESNDTYVNKTESGKVVKSIPKYHLEDSNSSSKQSSDGKTDSNSERSQTLNESDVAESAVEIDEDSSRIVSGADNNNDNLSGSNSEFEKATATVPLSTDDYAVLEAPQEENSSNQAVVAILISIGGLILCGIGVIIYLLIKKKKSGDSNEREK